MDVDLAGAIKSWPRARRVLAPGLLSSTPEPDADAGKLTQPRKADSGVDRQGEFQQGNRGAAGTEREYGLRASRQSDVSAGHPSHDGTGAVCGAQGAGAIAVNAAGSYPRVLCFFVQVGRAAADRPGLPFRLTDVTPPPASNSVHNSGAFGDKYLPETLGPGCAFLDYDNDGWQDILLINGMDWPGHVSSGAAPCTSIATTATARSRM